MEHYCGVICREVPEVQFPQLVFMSDRGGSGARFIPVELLHGCLQAHPRMGAPSRLPPGSSPGGSSPTLPPGSSLGGIPRWVLHHSSSGSSPGGSSTTSVPGSSPGWELLQVPPGLIPGWELLHKCLQAHPQVGAPPQLPPASSLGVELPACLLHAQVEAPPSVASRLIPGFGSSSPCSNTSRFIPGWELHHCCLQVHPWGRKLLQVPASPLCLIPRCELHHGCLQAHLLGGA